MIMVDRRVEEKKNNLLSRDAEKDYSKGNRLAGWRPDRWLIGWFAEQLTG